MRWYVFFDILDVEKKVVAAFHTNLQLDQINSKGRSVFKGGLAQPIVWSLVFADSHVGETTAERIEFSEVQVRECGNGRIGCSCSPSIDFIGAVDCDGSFNHDGLLFTSAKRSDIPCHGVVLNGRASSVCERHLFWKWTGDDHVVNAHRGNVFDFKFEGDWSAFLTRCD